MSIDRYAKAAALVIALASAPAEAAIQRTFVKSTGIDNLVCSLALPCRSFAAAITNTLPGGEVIVLDSAGYGTVTINKSVSIIAPRGVYAGISVDAAAANGITVGMAGIVVVLQGLSINGTGGMFGIRVLANAEVHVINCTVANMTSGGILAFAGTLFVSDSLLRDNGGHGAFINGPVTAVFERVRAENNVIAGILGSSGASVSIRESVLANNGQGADAQSNSGLTARMTVDDTLMADSGTGGGAGLTVNAGSSVGYLDVIRSTSTRSSTGSGIIVTAIAPATAVGTVADSVLTDNGASGLFVVGAGAVALANGNTTSRNSNRGLNGFSGGVVHTRSNNTGEQSSPTSGTVAVPGF